MNILNLLGKIKKYGLIGGAFSAGMASTYFTVNKRTQVVDLGMPTTTQSQNTEDTYFDKFVSKLAPLIANEEIDQPFEIEANFDNFEISWPGNTIEIDGQLDLSMKSLLNIDFTLDLDVDYNGNNLDLGLGYVDKTLYVATKDLRLKTSFVERSRAKEEFISMYDKIYDLFFNVDNEDGMQIDIQLDNILGSLIGGMDVSSLTSSLGGFSITETEDDSFAYTVIALNLSGSEINIEMKIDKETCSLIAIDLGTITINDLTISGGLVCNNKNDFKVLPFDDPNYTYKRRGEFIETFHYTNWIDDIFNLLKTRQIGLDISGSLVDGNKSYGIINVSADLDASRYKPLDLAGMIIGPELFGLTTENTPENVSFLESNNEITEENNILDLLNNFNFNIGIELSNIINKDGTLVTEDYSNLNLAYFKDADDKNTGYLSFNDDLENSVMRAKITTSTINYLIEEIPNLIESISAGKKSEESNGLFDFITSSELVTSINNGSYSEILNVLENVESTEDKIILTLSLKPLGFGDNAKVVITLDASDAQNRKVISILVNNAFIGGKELNLSINTRKYNGTHFEVINANRTSYDNLDFIEGTLDQIKEITEVSKLGFNLEGSVLGEDNLGFDFNGWAQLNYADLNGMGSIKLNEYKYTSGKTITPHTVDISIDDFGEDHSKNNMYFEYRDALKGKFTLKTFDDIFDLVMNLTKLEDTRFTKFLAPILEKISGSILVTAIKDSNYLALSQSSLVKSIKQTNDGSKLEIVLSKELLLNFVENDLTININFKNVEGKRRVDSIEINDFAVGDKVINFKGSIVKYDEEKTNPVDLNGNFLDFSDIAILLEFGINTTELNVYHLTADAGLYFKLISTNGSKLIDFKLDFYIYVNGETTKVYGKLPNNELHSGYSEFVFEPSHDESDKIGGYFHILRYEDGTLLTLFQDKTYYYYADSQSFLDNIVMYLLGDFIGVSTSVVDAIGDLNLDEEKETDPKWENILQASNSFPAFQYYTDHDSFNQWQVRVNLEAITENDKLGAIEATVQGEHLNGNNYLSRIKATMTIASVLVINADIQLNNPNPSEKDWPVAIENRYQQIISIYGGLSAKNQEKAKNAKTGVNI